MKTGTVSGILFDYMDIPMSLRFQMHTEISQFSFFCTTTIDKYVESFSNLNFDYSIALNKVTGTAKPL